MNSRHLRSVPDLADALAAIDADLEAIEGHQAAVAELTARVRERFTNLPAPEPAPEPELLSMGEAAAKLGVSHSFVKKAIGRGEIRVERFGRRVLIPIEALAEYRAAQREAG